MAKYLDERQIGFDLNVIGFPNLGDCLGVVLQTTAGLYGFHVFGLGGQMNSTFASYVSTHTSMSGAAMTHLYGACYHPNRYGGKNSPKWQAEMAKLATDLGYRGPVTGCDLSKGTKIGKTESTYAEFRRNGKGECDMFYKRMSKMTTATSPSGSGPDIKLIRKDMAAMKSKGLTHDDTPIYMSAKLPGLETTASSIVATKSNKGLLHQVKSGRIISFTH